MRQTLRESLQIARERHAVKSLVVLALVGAAGLLAAGYLLASKTSENQITGRALCALRDDVERRVEASKNYLATHPNGAPGIPAQVIRDGIANQQRTVDALSILKCTG